MIRKINKQNLIEKPELYTNYLEANAKSNANTIVGLFEEGDYEVSVSSAEILMIESERKLLINRAGTTNI